MWSSIKWFYSSVPTDDIELGAENTRENTGSVVIDIDDNGFKEQIPKTRGIGRIAMDSELARERYNSFQYNPKQKTQLTSVEHLRTLHRFGYTVGKHLGDGSYGSVFECFYKPNRTQADVIPLAVKNVSVPKDLVYSEGEWTQTHVNPEKFALILARHPNIICLYNVWSVYKSIDDTYPECVMFFMEKADYDFHDLLQEREKDLGRPIEEPEIKVYFRQIVSGLQYLHSIRIVHLDIKPENILIVKDQSTGEITLKISDFGLSYFVRPSEQTIEHYVGTEKYKAPEIKSGFPFDPFKADIYSLGQTLYFMIGFFDHQVLVHGSQQRVTQNKFVYISKDLYDFYKQLTASDSFNRPTIENVANNQWLN